MVLEIWCVFDIFISLFRLFFALLPLKQPYQWNFSKNKKSTWIYDQFTYVHQKLLWDDLQFLRYGGWKMELLILIWGYLLPFYLSNSLKNKNLKKWKKKKKKNKNFKKLKKKKKKKKNWRYHHFTHMYQNLLSDDLWFLRYRTWQMELRVLILGYFSLFYPFNSLNNQIFEKMKKNSGDIIIFHMWTKNYDETIYSFRKMVRERWKCYFWFLTIFCPFTPAGVEKLKNLKK